MHALQHSRAVNLLQERKLRQQRFELRTGESPLPTPPNCPEPGQLRWPRDCRSEGCSSLSSRRRPGMQLWAQSRASAPYSANTAGPEGNWTSAPFASAGSKAHWSKSLQAPQCLHCMAQRRVTSPTSVGLLTCGPGWKDCCSLRSDIPGHCNSPNPTGQINRLGCRSHRLPAGPAPTRRARHGASAP